MYRPRWPPYVARSRRANCRRNSIRGARSRSAARCRRHKPSVFAHHTTGEHSKKKTGGAIRPSFRWLEVLSKLAGVFGEVIRHACGIGLHRGLALVPAGQADFAVFLEELQRIDQAQHLIDLAAERQVVHHLVLHDTLAIDEERTTQGDAVRVLYAVGAGDLVLDVSDDGESHGADSALVHRRVAGGGMGELRFVRHALQIDTTITEHHHTKKKGDDLGVADEGEIQRPDI